MVLVTFAACSHERLIKDDEVFLVENSLGIITEDGQKHEYSVVDVRIDSLFGISTNRAKKGFSRSKITSIVMEKRINFLPYSLAGAVGLGTLGYLIALEGPEPNDPLEDPLAGAMIYGGYGVGIGYLAAKANSGKYTLILNQELYDNYMRDLERQQEEENIRQIQGRILKNQNI